MKPIDFLPERIKLRRARKKRLIRHAYIIGACVLVLAGIGYRRSMNISTAEAELASLHQRAANMEHQLQRRMELEREQAELLIMKRIEEHLGSRISALALLSELEDVLPSTVTLTNLSTETQDVVLRDENDGKIQLAGGMKRVSRGKSDQEIVKRIRIVLTGIAPSDVDVANFIGQLSASQLFEDVNMGYARNREFDGRVAREFEATCYVIR